MCLAVAEVMLSSGRQDADSALAFYATGAIRGTQVVLSGSTCLRIALRLASFYNSAADSD